MKFFNRRAKSDAAKSVADQAATARRIVGIDDQELLDDARTNPATRGDADRLRIERHREQLRLEHRRSLRRERVTDTQASAAEKALEAIASARAATSPGRSVAKLKLTRAAFTGLCLVFSIALSIGSGAAIETWLQGLERDSMPGLGYLVEAGLTVLATVMIVIRGILAAEGTTLKDWQTVVFWLVIGVPLIISAILATLGSPIGALFSAGAAAWSLSAYLTATSLSTAIGDALDKVDGTDEDQLRRVAFDDTDAQPEPGRRPRSGAEWVTEQTEVGLDEIEQFLADQDGPDTGPTGAAHTDPTGGGPTPRQSGVPTRVEVEEAWRRQQAQNAGQSEGHTVADQHENPNRSDRSEDGMTRTSPAIAARRATGQTNLRRVADYRKAHPAHNVDQIADALSLSPSTIKRHIRTLRGGDE